MLTHLRIRGLVTVTCHKTLDVVKKFLLVFIEISLLHDWYGTPKT